MYIHRGGWVAQNLKLLARQQRVTTSDECSQSQSTCDSSSCENEGVCERGWGRTTCGCEQTPYTGSQCAQESVILRFNGRDHFTVTPRNRILSIVEEVSLHFRTRHSSGALLSTRSKDGKTSLEIFLSYGKLFIRIQLLNAVHVLEAGEGLNDYHWYALTLRREARVLEVILNGERVHNAEIPSQETSRDLLDDMITIDEINLGSPTDASGSLQKRSVEQLENKVAFIGHIRQFIFNKIAYTELAYQGNAEEISYSAEFSSAPVTPLSPVSIGSEETYVEHDLPHTNFHSLYLQLRTSQPTGALRYIYSIQGATGMIETESSDALNDRKWHDVVIMRLSDGSYYLIVDDVKYANAEPIKSKQFQLNSPVYVAGVASDMYAQLPTTIKAPHGFVGCLASLDINGVQPDLISAENGNKHKLISGCFDSETCEVNSCKNGGTCMENWPTISCNCQLTSFTGPTCSDDGTTYQFGNIAGGLVTYTFPYPQPDSTEDTLAFGLMTIAQKRALLFRLTSVNSADRLEVSVMDGIVKAVFNVGTRSRSLFDSKHLVNDGKYHVIVFTRSGGNATLKIDNHPEVSVNPKKDRLTVFNSMDKLSIGLDLTETGSFSHPFFGLISGLTFNSIQVLDLAKSNHPSITIQGDAVLADLDDSELQLRMQNEEEDDEMANKDDIILPSSGAVVSPCQSGGVDPDFCNEDTGSDDLITTKIVVSEKVPARVTNPPPLLNWSEDVSVQTEKPDVTKGEIFSRPAEQATPRRRTTLPVEREMQSLATADGPFDLQKNLPLIAGICGAALVTAICIGVIIYRLTRKQQESYPATPQHRPSCSIDDDLRLDIKEYRAGSSTADTTLPVSSLNRRADSKEWYV
ncbi:Nrx-1 [Bugula neritina]|uniref:Nrx-1 n=1 Tax=Bugula neritina TaxID=10212 RepID=A0A7J7KDU7_BUGNE|nr:Nrx-1 [Bugula neritina]